MNQKFQNAILKNRKMSSHLVYAPGRSLPQTLSKLRAENSFMDLCKKPKLAAEVALGPIADFDFDVSILFSDLLFPLEAMGMDLTMCLVLNWGGTCKAKKI